MDGEVDAVEVAVEQEGLVDVEGKSSDDKSEAGAVGLWFFYSSELLCDPASDDFIGFSSGAGRDEGVEWENAD